LLLPPAASAALLATALRSHGLLLPA
jgi:hypothetical protein